VSTHAEVLIVKRTLLIAFISSVTSILSTMIVLTLALPSVVSAEEATLHADQSIGVGPGGADRIRLSMGQGINATVAVLGTDGRMRTLMGAGGPTGNEPETADFVLWAQDGTRIARLGTRNTPSSHAAGVDLALADSAGHVRIDMAVDENGTPSIQMFDADGNATWSAP
jgi:hypothetical protein